MDDIEGPLTRLISRMPFEEYDAGIVAGNGHTVISGPELDFWSQDTLVLGNIVLQIFQEGGPNFYECGNDNELISLGIALPGPSGIVVDGVDLSNGHMVVMRPGGSLTSFSPSVTRFCIFSFPVCLLDDFADSYDRQAADILGSCPTVIPIRTKDWNRIFSVVFRVVQAVQDGEALNRLGSRKEAASELITFFLQAVVGFEPFQPNIGRPRRDRYKILHRLNNYLELDVESSRTVRDMAHYCRVPERSLRNITQEFFGMAPKNLIRLKLINAIHEKLLEATSPQTVTQIVTDHGIWELGRFARQYFDIFHEYPSETLKSPKVHR